MDLNPRVKDLYIENYKALKKEMENHTHTQIER